MDVLKIITSVFNTQGLWDLFKGKERRQIEFIQALNEQILKSSSEQIKVNIEEAKHKSVFVAGWRPFIGWVCGTALLYHYILKDILLNCFQIQPIINSNLSELIVILTGMLGMSTLRTYEKLKIKK